ncbi:MAG: GntR family transcriptional regulator [Candidatus Kryptoniota bacterium]
MNKKKYESLKEQLLDFIRKNNLTKGSKLPKVREMINTFGYSYATINRTLLEMSHDGYITKIQGSGIFVNYEPGAKDEITNKKQVAFIIPKALSNGKIFTDILSGLRKSLEKEKIYLWMGISDMSHEKEKETIERLISNHVDGMIIFLEDCYRLDYSHIAKLKERNFPFVLVDRFIPELDTDYVVINNKDAIIRVCSYLKYTDQCDTIIFISHEDTATSHYEKIEGFRNAMKILYNNDNAEICKIEEFIENYEALNKPGRIIGLFFFDDLEIAILRKRLEKKGISLSENFKIFGYNNCYEVHNYPTVEQFNDRVGEKAGELLIRRMKNPQIETVHERIEPKLVLPDGIGGTKYEVLVTPSEN